MVYSAFGEDDFNMMCIGSTLLPLVTFVAANVFLTVLDLTGKPALLLKYKIQEEKHVPVSWEKYKTAVKLCVFNMTVVGFMFNLVTYPLLVWRGCDTGYELPSFTTTIWHAFCFIVIEEIGFYYGHRLLHHPKLYKHFHKIHHEWTAPSGIISAYCHPVEQVLSNLFPVWLGPMVMGSHMSVVWIWYVIAVLNTTVSHCGYHFPVLQSPEAHDYHHLKFNQMFGVMGVLDRLHGTDELFRRSKQHERHIVVLGLTPAKVMYPDQAKKEDCCCN